MSKKLSVDIKDFGDDVKITFHPESLAILVADLKEEGMSDEEIVLEVEKMKVSILADFQSQMEAGTLNDDSEENDEGSGCGDPNCPSCGSSITYH